MKGKTLANYRITEKIGEGGMGEVWKALDTTLGREVAIKILPESFSSDADRRARFEREARLLASLNHSGIATIHGLHDVDGVRFLAMEFVPGMDLARRLERGPLPFDEALQVAANVADALEAAHNKGIIHRDLKPANIVLGDDNSVKVLDFGLAKMHGADDETGESDLSTSPTVISSGTVAGVILGTAGYMSPEQARGKPVNKQTDIWAFGCLLYEILTGQKAFAGETVSDTIALVLQGEPAWGELPPSTPLGIRALLRRCLCRDHRDRLHDIADARIEIAEILADPSGTQTASLAPTTRRARWPLVLPWVLVGALALLLGQGLLRESAHRNAPEWSEILPPRSTSGINPAPAVSPDGSSIVFRAMNDGGATTLWVRSFGSSAARELPGTEDAVNTFWSPDDQSIAFFDLLKGELKRIDVADGASEVLAAAANNRGGAWSADGRILFAPTGLSGLHVVSASGGNTTQVTKPRTAAEWHTWPHFLSDGKRFLFLAGHYAGDSALYVGSLDSAEIELVGDLRSRVEYADGYLLYGERDVLLARPFDEEALDFHGEPIRLIRGVGNRFGDDANYAFSVSGEVLVSSNGSFIPETELLSMDRQGRILHPPGISGEIIGFSLPPDGKTIALERRDPAANTTGVWIADLAAGNPLRFTSESPSGMPVWSPDSRRLLTTNWSDSYSIKNVEDGTTEKFYHGKDAGGWPTNWSSDGQTLVFNDNDPGSMFDIWTLSLTAPPEATPLIQARYRELQEHLSKDSRWIAYVSDESGEYEVYIQSFPKSGRRIRVSVDGGTMPIWRDDGQELYFVRGDGAFMVVGVTLGSYGLSISTPQVLFQAPRLFFEVRRQYCVLDNGERFIFNAISDSSPQSVRVLRNWQSVLEPR